MDQHVGNKSPRLLPLVWIVDEQLTDSSIALRVSVGSIVTEQDDLHQGDEDHADGGRPAAVFLFISPVCVYKA